MSVVCAAAEGEILVADQFRGAVGHSPQFIQPLGNAVIRIAKDLRHPHEGIAAGDLRLLDRLTLSVTTGLQTGMPG